MAKIGVYHSWGKRTKTISKAIYEGIKRVEGVNNVSYVDETKYREPVFPVAVFYSLRGNLEKMLWEYRDKGLHAVYIDLGYWGRRMGGVLSGYHKFAINDRHPTKYFQNVKHPNDRAQIFNIQVKKWRKSGKHILLAGMGDKAAAVEGFKPEEWENAAIAELQKHTDRPIIYRPKPSWLLAKPLRNAGYSRKTEFLETALKDCYAVVTHHSNVAVEGIVAGIPAICMQGVAQPFSRQEISKIDDLYYPEEREQWVNDICYCQFNTAEMCEGVPWRHLKDEGLVP